MSVFTQQQLGQIVCLNTSLIGELYVAVFSDHFHPFMDSMDNNDGFFQLVIYRVIWLMLPSIDLRSILDNSNELYGLHLISEAYWRDLFIGKSLYLQIWVIFG